MKELDHDTPWNYYKFVVEPDFTVIAHANCKDKKPLAFEREVKNATGA